MQELKFISAILTKFSSHIMPLSSTSRARLCAYLGLFKHVQFGSDYACWHSDNAIAHYHNKRSQYLSQHGLRRNIAISDGCHCYDSPIDASWNAIKSVLCSFNNIHQGANNQISTKYTDEEYCNFRYAQPQGGG